MKKKKKAITLIEIMIVIAIIGIVAGVLGYNMRGSLEKGKAFKTEQAKAQLHDLLFYALSSGDFEKGEDVLGREKECLTSMGIAKDPAALLKDGWGTEFKIEFKDDDFIITSENYDRYVAKLNRKKAKK